MLEPGCRSGRLISARPVRGPEDIQRRSLQILVRPTATVLSWPRQLDERVPGALRLEVVAGLGERQPRRVRELRDHPGREALRGVDAGAHRRTAQRELGDPGQGRLQPLDAVAHRRGVPAELLAEHHRRRVHQVRAAGLHHLGELLGLRLEHPGQVVQRRHQCCTVAAVAATWIEVGNVSLEDWLAFTWSLGCTSTPDRAARGRRAPRSCSCSTRCRSRSGTRPPGSGRGARRRRSPRPRTGSPRPARRSSTPSSAFTVAAAALTRAMACTCSASSVAPLIGKFSTARWVWARHRASCGTSTSPMLSCSMR